MSKLFDRIVDTVRRLTPSITPQSIHHTLPAIQEKDVAPAEPVTQMSDTQPYMEAANKLATIRKSAQRLRMVYIKYNGTKRLVEPYSLRNGKSGVLFYAVEQSLNHVKSYYIDNITETSASDIPFTPRWKVEF